MFLIPYFLGVLNIYINIQKNHVQMSTDL